MTQYFKQYAISWFHAVLPADKANAIRERLL
jgi:hypothetical protein